MALAKGVNSYATLAEANSYFADRLDIAAWTEASDENKSKALVTATRYLDELKWAGTAVSATQSLAFPRSGSYFDPKLGIDVDFLTSYPKRLLTATYELAYHLLNNDGLLDDVGAAVDIRVGSIQLSKVTSANKLPKVVDNLINPMLASRGSKLWWRAN